jgi:hypothetical protein
MCKKFIILSFNILLLISLSCTFEHKTKINYRLESFTGNSRVFYGETGDPCESDSISKNCERLSTEEVNQIQNLISERTQTPIWFVRVPLMSSEGHRSQLWLYLVPDVADNRYRSGLAYTIQLSKSLKEQYVSEPWRYVQVSLPNETFDNLLETPKVYDLPFPYPSLNKDGSQSKQNLLSQKELIDILDYVRDPNTYINLKSTSGRILFPPSDIIFKIITLQPIVGFNRDADEITVTLGFVHNGLFARCLSIKLKRNGKDYKLIEQSLWIA